MKKIKIIFVVLIAVVILWSSMLIKDTVRSNDFKEPVFAQLKEIQPDDHSHEYQGIGYTVNISYYEDESGDIYFESSEVRLFGILISAVIV